MIHRAIAYSALAHSGQKRKGTAVPYITHPFEVALILTKAGASEDLVCAGLLHDVVEDTTQSLEDIKKNFGEDVAKLVEVCSEDKSKSWEARKEHSIGMLKNGVSEETMLLFCADKLANIRSLTADFKAVGESLWDRFNRGKEQQKWYYKELIDALTPLADYGMYQEMKGHYYALFEGGKK